MKIFVVFGLMFFSEFFPLKAVKKQDVSFETLSLDAHKNGNCPTSLCSNTDEKDQIKEPRESKYNETTALHERLIRNNVQLKTERALANLDSVFLDHACTTTGFYEKPEHLPPIIKYKEIIDLLEALSPEKVNVQFLKRIGQQQDLLKELIEEKDKYYANLLIETYQKNLNSMSEHQAYASAFSETMKTKAIYKEW